MTPILRSFLRRPLQLDWDDSGAGFLTAPVFDGETSEFTGAAYRADGSLILQSLRPSQLGHWRPIDPISLPPMDQEPMLTPAIHGGHFFNIWGHFLLETLSTAASCPQMPNYPVVFTPFAPGTDPLEFQAAWTRILPILQAAGWGERPLVLQTGPMRFSRLIVPERLYVYAAPVGHPSLANEMAEVYATVRAYFRDRAAPGRIVVARRPNWAFRKHPAEEAVYEALASIGALIVDGVSTSPEAQAAQCYSATALVGFAGSNLHNCIFTSRGTPVLEIGDQRSYQSCESDRRNNTQVALCNLLGQPLTFIESFHERDGGLVPLDAASIITKVCSVLR